LIKKGVKNPYSLIHRPLGIAILILVVVRFVNRQLSALPPFPATMSRAERRVAHASELLMYGLMFVLPLVGWGMVSAARYPIVLYGSLHLPFILPHNRAVVGGDFAMREDELQGVLKALRSNGIHVVAIHNHMTGESPRIIFLHYWGVGPIDRLEGAQGGAGHAEPSPGVELAIERKHART
jgi:cytochrome b561